MSVTVQYKVCDYTTAGFCEILSVFFVVLFTTLNCDSVLKVIWSWHLVLYLKCKWRLLLVSVPDFFFFLNDLMEFHWWTVVDVSFEPLWNTFQHCTVCSSLPPFFVFTHNTDHHSWVAVPSVASDISLCAYSICCVNICLRAMFNKPLMIPGVMTDDVLKDLKPLSLMLLLCEGPFRA